MPKGYSLHIGLNVVDPNHYGGWDGQLNACVADARDMESLAKAAGYDGRAVVLDGEATSERVITEMLGLARLLEPEDALFLTYSGHGGQVPDEASEEEDRYDETWCLFDRQLIDDELYGLFHQFRPGVRIVMLSDSCHSGTMAKARLDATAGASTGRRSATRGDNEGSPKPASRLAPIQITLEAYNNNKGLYLALQSAGSGSEDREPEAGVILISGCQDGQESLDGTTNGLFTATLKRVWETGRFVGGYRLFHTTIAGRMPPTQTPNLFMVGQVPPAFVNQKPFTI